MTGGQESCPVPETARITSLDLIRGVAVLGILLMNAVSFKYGLAPYLNLSAGGSETWLDWAVGIFGEIFIDQKFMALFSMLFRAGILLFIERAERREERPVLLNLWRNALLLGGVDVNRAGILLFCLAVRVLQLWWSQSWLERFRFGPAEWLWRVATYRKGQPLRRRPAGDAGSPAIRVE